MEYFWTVQESQLSTLILQGSHRLSAVTNLSTNHTDWVLWQTSPRITQIEYCDKPLHESQIAYCDKHLQESHILSNVTVLSMNHRLSTATNLSMNHTDWVLWQTSPWITQIEYCDKPLHESHYFEYLSKNLINYFETLSKNNRFSTLILCPWIRVLWVSVHESEYFGPLSMNQSTLGLCPWIKVLWDSIH